MKEDQRLIQVIIQINNEYNEGYSALRWFYHARCRTIASCGLVKSYKFNDSQNIKKNDRKYKFHNEKCQITYYTQIPIGLTTEFYKLGDKFILPFINRNCVYKTF
jgi:hypothetical protein